MVEVEKNLDLPHIPNDPFDIEDGDRTHFKIQLPFVFR